MPESTSPGEEPARREASNLTDDGPRASEDRPREPPTGRMADFYRELFENMSEGFSFHEVITDSAGAPVDFRFIQVNEAYERHTGLKAVDVIGKTMLEINPDSDRDTIRRYGEVGLTGKPLSSSYRSRTFGKWLKVKAYCPRRGFFATIFEDVTEDREREEELREARLRLDAILSNSFDAIGVHHDGLWDYCNRAALSMFGFSSPEDLVGRPIAEVIAPEERQRIREYVSRRIEGSPAPTHYITKGLRRDGVTFDLEVFLSRYELDGTTHFLVNLRDISERLRDERLLALSEQRFRNAFDLAPTGICFTGFDGRILKVNAAFSAMLGYSAGELEGMLATRITHPDDDEATLAHIQKLASGQASIVRLEKRYLHKDGSIVWVDLSSSVIRMDDTTTVLITTLVDITALKRTQSQLSDSEERYRELYTESELILQTSPIGIAKVKGRKFEWVNQAFLASFGYAMEEIVGRDTRMLYAEDETYVRLAGSYEHLRSHETFNTELRLAKADGSAFFVNMTGRAIDSENPAEGSIWLFEDIDRRKLQEAEIERLLQEKETILKEAHHRIKNNMSTVASFLELKTAYISTPEAIEALAETEALVRGMSLLYEKLYRSPDTREMPIGDYLPAMMRESLSVLGKAGSVRLATELPDLVLPAKTLSNLGIVINELITNSVKYAYDATTEPKIGLTASVSEAGLRIVYEDNGTGLPQGFDPWSSDGFGMILITNIMASLKGSVSVEPAAGVRFILEMPI